MVRSVRETAFRMFWIFDCGLPDPVVNAVVRDTSGRLLGIGDLLDPATGLLGEYDGAQHREEISTPWTTPGRRGSRTAGSRWSA